jgi:hypothetical protein
VSGNRFIETVHGLRTERQIRDEAELKALLTDYFGICHVGNDVLAE